MAGNPLLLGFLAFGVLILIALGVLAMLQRRMFADQARQVQELLREAQKIAEEERRGHHVHGDGDSDEGDGPARF